MNQFGQSVSDPLKAQGFRTQRAESPEDLWKQLGCQLLTVMLVEKSREFRGSPFLIKDNPEPNSIEDNNRGGAQTMYEISSLDNEIVGSPVVTQGENRNGSPPTTVGHKVTGYNRCMTVNSKNAVSKPRELRGNLNKGNPELSSTQSRKSAEIRLGGMTKENSPIKLARKLLLGTLLGDSGIVKTWETKAYLKMCHANNQLEYLIWKAEKLFPLIGRFSFNERPSRFNGRVFKNRYKTVSRTLSSKYLKHIYDDFYFNRNGEVRKEVHRNILNRLTPISIAVWYGDDGSLRWKSRSTVNIPKGVNLSTHSFTLDENQLIIDFFKKRFDILFKKSFSKRSQSWWIHTTDVDKFLSIVSPYLKEVKCLGYKMDPNILKTPNRSARRLSEYKINEEIIRTPGPVGRPFGFKLSKESRLKAIKNLEIGWKRGSREVAEMTTRLV